MRMYRRRLVAASAVVVGLCAWGGVAPRRSSEGLPAGPRRQVVEALGKLPLYFVENRGQLDARVAYYIQGRDKAVYFTAAGVTFALTDAPAPRALRASWSGPAASSAQRWAVKLDFVGANPEARPVAEDPTPAVISYFKGSREEWKAGLRTYSRLVYADLWPGIDLVYSGTSSKLKYTFVVKPGASPEQIRLVYRGVTGLKTTSGGELEVTTPVASFRDEKPYAWQEAGAGQVPVAASYALEAGAREYGFRVGDYDRSRPLILDPAVLVYAGYIGGSGDDLGRGIAVDGSGNAYVTGMTGSSEATFPETVGPDLTFNGFQDAFVAKVNAAGTALVYAGYIGGSSSDAGNGIAVDGSGNAYVTGTTGSSEATFPATGGPDLTYNGGADAFVAKVNAAGTALIYAGYIGGSGFDFGLGIAVDGSGNAYVTGLTFSSEATFPATVGPDLTSNGTGDAFVAKVNASGTALVYAGYIGGSTNDAGNGIAVDGSGNAYVTGRTDSSVATFPETVGPDLTHNGGGLDAFVAKVNAAGTALVYAGYIGGNGIDDGTGIAVDGSGNAYVTGHTVSSEATFPATGGPDLTSNGGRDAFVAKVNAAGTALVYAGYIGGSGEDEGRGIAVDGSGNAHVVGQTRSTEATFPGTGGPDLTFNGVADAFVAKVNAAGTALVYAGYIGGNSIDDGTGIAVDGSGNAYVTGSAGSSEATFPEIVGPDLTHNGFSDAFVAKISETGLASPRISAGGVVGAGLSIPVVRQLAPGSIATLFGEGFWPSGSFRLVGSNDLINGRLPVNLAGVCVQVGDQMAPLFHLFPGQINFQIPAVPAGAEVSVQVILNCGARDEIKSNVERLGIQAASPEFFYFVQNVDGRNPIAAIRPGTAELIGPPDLVPGVAFTAARPGEVLTLFGTGFGPTNPPFLPGELPDRIAPVTSTVRVTIGGLTLPDQDVLYAGVTGFLAGVYQLNIRIPDSAPNGELPVSLQIGSFSSPRGGFLTVRQ